MSGTSPEAILYDSAGNLLAVQNGVAIPASTPGLISMGSDGTNSRYILVDSSGRTVSVGAGTAGTPSGGVFSVQGVAGGTNLPVTVSGTATVSGTVTANQGTANTIANSWPVEMTDGTNILGTAAHPVRIDPTGTTTQPVSGTVTANAGSGNFAVVQATASNLNATVVASGNFNNASVSATAASPPASATYIGGSVTTAAPTYTTGQMNALSLTTTGLLRVDGSGVTQPISGTVTANAGTGTFTVSGTVAATQSGTWTVQPGNTANTTPWLTTINQGGNSVTVTASNALKVDGSAVTQPVSGTVTANIGTTNGLALDTSVNGILVSQGSTTSGEKGPLIQGAVTTAAPIYTTGQTNPLSLTTAGALRIDGSAVTQPVSGTVTANAGTGNFTVVQATAANLKSQTASESTTATSTGTVASLIGGAVTTASPTYTTGQMDPLSLTTAGALRVDGSGVTQPVSGTVTANAGTGTFTVAGTVTANIGTTNGLALDTSVNGLLLSQASTTSGQKGPLIQGAVTTAAPTYTTGQTDPLSLTTAGALRVDGSGTTQPVSGTVTANQGGTWTTTVTQATATNLNAQVSQGPGSLGNSWWIRVTDGTNTAAVKAGSAAAVAADPALVVSLSPNSPLPTGTNNIGSVNNVQTAESTAAWTSATANNTALALTVTGYGTVTVTLNQGSTITGGAVTFEASDTVAGTNWYPVSMVSTSGATVPVSTYTLVASTNIAFQTNIAGFIQFRVRLSPAITGTGTVNVGIAGNASATEWQQATYITDGSNGPVAVKAASTAPTVSDKALVVVLSPNQQAIPVSSSPATSTPAIAAGYVLTSATTKTAVIASTYVEQTTNAQRSFKSASASDAAAGTGARTIVLTYYDQTMAGPFTETITLNGTTAVNTVSTTIAYVESIVVATAGSTSSNVGIISMFTTTGGGGTTMATINATENKTFWGNHYVATGKTCYITGLSGNNTNTSNGSILTLTAFNPTSANATETQISDFVRVGGGTSQPVRVYNQLIKVVGPNRIRLYEACEGTANITTRGAFDYYDQ
jgi:hypothetical protein